jgi:hypothetical protein
MHDTYLYLHIQWQVANENKHLVCLNHVEDDFTIKYINKLHIVGLITVLMYSTCFEWGTRWRSFWGTALQAGRLRVQFLMWLLKIFIDIILPAALCPLGSTQHLTEHSTRNISFCVKGAGEYSWQPPSFMCRLSWNLGASTSWNPQGLSSAVIGFLLLYLYTFRLDWLLILSRQFTVHAVSGIYHTSRLTACTVNCLLTVNS